MIFVKKRIPLLASFLVPLLILIIICIARGVFPFGDQCILQVDMYHQYCPFFTELMDKMKQGGSFFYSFRIGLGADFASLYAYYLASPLNWLLILWPKEYVIEFMTILVLLKIALCGLTFGYYLKHHFRTNHFAVCIFGTAYALSAFMAAYAWNIMWTDCLVLAPLIILGLERLVKEGRPILYYSTLAVCIFSNYYISIMICIFLVLWFFLLWYENRDQGIRPAIRFFGYSLLAGGTGAVLIIPEAIVLGYSGSQHINFPDQLEWYFNLAAELARHSVMTEAYTGREHWPNLYCGVFVLVFLVLYVLNREISWKKKLAKLMLAAFFVVSFANNILDFLWHGLHFPDSLPGRQTFLYIFLLLVISFEAFLHLKGTKLWHVAAAGAVNAVFLAAAYLASDRELVSGNAFFATSVLLICYLTLLTFYLTGTPKMKLLMLGVGFLTMLSELSMNYNATGLGTTSRVSYTKDLKDYEKVLTDAAGDAAGEGIPFYRTEEMERRTKNDAALSGYRSATQFSSLMNLNVSHFYQNLGMEGGKNFYCANGVTPLFSAMLSLKYVLADNPLEESPVRTLVTSSGDTYLYENRHFLPLGFMMEEEVIDAWDYENAGDIAAQNELAHLLGAKEDMLAEADAGVETAPGETVITTEEDGYLFAAYGKTEIENLKAETSDGREKSFTKVSHNYTLDLGYCRAGTEVRVKNTVNKELELTVYRLNLEAVDAAVSALSRQTLTLTDFSDTRIAGTIEVKEAGRLIFSIAKEQGWSLYVDGAAVEPEAFGGAFLSVRLEEGMHEVELLYRTPGFGIGAGISVISVLIFGIVMVVRKRAGIKIIP